MKLILDTNVYISAALFPQSAPSDTLKQAIKVADLYLSLFLFEELKSTLMHKKFDRYIDSKKRILFLDQLINIAIFSEPLVPISDCRDPDDNHLLSLAVSENVNLVISGDQDLLVLNPYRNIPILTPREFLNII